MRIMRIMRRHIHLYYKIMHYIYFIFFIYIYMKKRYTKKYSKKRHPKNKHSKNKRPQKRNTKKRNTKKRNTKKRLIGGSALRRELFREKIAEGRQKNQRLKRVTFKDEGWDCECTTAATSAPPDPTGTSQSTSRFPRKKTTAVKDLSSHITPEGWKDGGYSNVGPDHVVVENEYFRDCFAKECIMHNSDCQGTPATVATEHHTRVQPYNWEKDDSLEDEEEEHKVIVSNECKAACVPDMSHHNPKCKGK
jgi:hypothetical protein